ncbi:MAG: GrpB family protein [Acidimicrobiia bacterium]
MTLVVEIVAYNVDWPKRFNELARDMRIALGEVATRIDHIGSTAIPDLAAKPIIDIQISVDAFDPHDAYRLPLEKLGYVWRATNPELTKRYFREPLGSPRTHVHVRRTGSWAEQFALLFRDYLRCHPEEARKYEEVKRSLTDKFRGDRPGYTEAKQPFIWELMGRADSWSQEIGWTPEPSDA